MKKKLRKLSLVLLFTLVSLITSAQVRTKVFRDGVPATLVPAKTADIPEILVKSSAEFNKLVSQKDSTLTEYSNRFAVSQQVNLDLLSRSKTFVSNDTTIFITTIHAENALNISVEFSDFMLSPNSILSIYTDHELTDSITADENNKNRIWATRVYQGNKITILLKTPSSDKEGVSLKISKINFGFKKFGGEYFGSPGASAVCNINVLCPAANGWQNERNSVALVVANGLAACTGSLIMNSCGSRIPYFLTANHCLDAGNVQNWVFQFQFWSATCTPNSGWTEDIQFNGCNLRANYAPSDFALLELNQTPLPASGIFYSGWNRNTTTPNGSVGLHHPEGDLMKFSQDNDPSGVSSWGGTNNHWVDVFEQGTVEPGSSGSPLYDMNHRIVGQLHGDQLNTGLYCTQRRGEYGKFDLSWTGGGTNSTRLSNWLDPFNIGAATTNTTNVSTLVAPHFTHPELLSISGPTLFCTSSTYSVANLPTGVTVSWSVNLPGIVSSSISGNATTLTKVLDGSITLQATIVFPCATVVLHKNIAVGRPTGAIGHVQFNEGVPANPMYVCKGAAGRGTMMYYDDFGNASGPTGPYSFEITSGLKYSFDHASGNNFDYEISPTASGTLHVPVQVNNGCGLSTYNFILDIQVQNCLALSNYNISPNPANQEIKATYEPINSNITKFTQQSETVPISSIDLISIQGNVLKTVINKDRQQNMTINVSDLPNGIYFLNLKIGSESVRKKVVILH